MRGVNMSKKNAESRIFICPSCGLEMDYDAASGSVRCKHCGAVESVCADGDGEDVDFTALEADPAQHEWGFPVKTLLCGGCGARLVVSAETAMLSCPLCSSSQISASSELPGMRPDSVIPFRVDINDAGARFVRWLKRLKMAPFSMKKAYAAGTLAGMYVPYWSFDAKTRSAYSGQAGSHYREAEQDTRTEDGRTQAQPKSSKKTRWQFVSGSYEKAFNGIIYNDSKGIGEDAIQRIEPFKLNELTKFSPKHLGGFSALQYDAGIKSVWGRAKSFMGGVIRQDVRGIVKRGSDVLGAIKICTDYHDIQYRHMLLPVWTSSYRYKNKQYPFYINGQTGEITGSAPRSALKISIIVLVCLGLLAALYFLLLKK
jgi:hypothetical protein